MRNLLALLAGPLLVAACEPAPATEPAILVFSKTAAFRHASIDPGIAALRALGDRQGLRIDATEDAATFTTEGLAPYDVVVFLSTTGDVLDPAQQQAFEAFIRAGGGFVGIHAASDTEYDWPWYGQLVGGYFDGHPSGPNVRDGRLFVAEPRHAATTALPSPWLRTDEWYDIRDFNPDVTVLLTIDEATYKTAEEGPAPTPRPIAWLHEFDGGRAFYTALGHTTESFSEAEFLDHVWGGLAFTLGRDP